MRVQQVLGFALSFAIAADARRPSSQPAKVVSLIESAPKVSVAFASPAAANVKTKNFLISDLYINEFSDPSNTQLNRTISFLFHDLNSNSSTICTDSWLQTPTNNSDPTLYTQCDPTGADEYFLWQFASYTNISHFSLNVAHVFKDPVDFPPPYEYPEFFSSPFSANLTCATSSQTGLTGCALPASESPIKVPVTSIAD